MTKLKSIATKVFLSILIILSFFVAQNAILFSGINYFNNEITTTKAISNSDIEDLSSKVLNNQFSETTSGSQSTTGSTSVLNPTSWTKMGEVNSENMRAGVITISDKTSFNQNCEEYLLEENSDYPVGTVDSENGNKVLFIRSKTATTFGFKSSLIELDANSYYAISVKYFTGDGTASVGVSTASGFVKTENTIIKNLNSNKTWATATIFVSTGQIEKTSINLELHLGSPVWTNSDIATLQSGFVLFDNVTLFKYSKNGYNEAITSAGDIYDRKVIADEQKYDNVLSGDGFVLNGSFADSSNNWQFETTGASEVDVINSNYDYFGVIPKTNQRSNDQNILSIFNAKQNEATGKTNSSPIVIKQNKIYRISIWAKTNAGSIDFELKTEEDEIIGTTYSPATINEVSSQISKTTNDWNEYVFFVTGNSLCDVNVILSLGLSSSGNTNDEYLFVDDITTQIISSDDLDKASNSGITYATLSINPSPSLNIENGYFNSVSGITRNGTYPLSANSFERIDSNNQNISGVINLESSIFNETKIDFGNPSNKPESYVYGDDVTMQNVSNNVLLMFNPLSSHQTTKSTSSLSASENSCYVLSLNVFTDIKNSTGGANIYLTDGTNTICEICDINTQASWKYYKIYFKNYGSSQTLTAKIGFGRENNLAQGFAYFDNFEWNTYSEDITTIEENQTTKIINLSKDVEKSSKVILTENFDEYETSEISETNHLNNPLYWTGEVKATQTDEMGEVTTLSDQDITAGVLNKNNITKVIGSQTVSNTPENSYLFIKSTSDNYYAFSNKLAYNFTSGSYYQISVKVKTINLSQQNENQKTIDGSVVPYGASIILEGFDKQFVGINTNGSFNSNNGFETFKFYINPSEDASLNLILGLGSKDALTSGYALFDEVIIIEMNEDEFNLCLNSDLEDLSLKNHVLSVTTSKDDDEGGVVPADRTYQETLAWLAIPTIIIALGIIAAIIGFCIKKYLENRPVKVTVKNSYDRESTLLKELDHKNYRTSVNHKLKLLKEELAQTEQYLKEEKEEHAKQKEAYETAKEIAEQDKSIKLETPDKHYTSYEERVLKLEKNIASIKADIKILEEEQEKLNKKSKQMREKDLKGNEVKVSKKHK